MQEGRERLVVPDVDGFPLESNWNLVAPRDRCVPYAAREVMRFASKHAADCIEAEWIYPDIGQVAEDFIHGG